MNKEKKNDQSKIFVKICKNKNKTRLLILALHK